MEYDYREETIADESAEEERVKASYEAQGYTFINKVFPIDKPGMAVLQFRKGDPVL